MLLHRNKYIKIWLISVLVCIAMMVILGGFTRLTGSGLSIVDWRPVTGILPPLNEIEWISEFEKYKTSPEFQKVNSHFKLEDYQYIYWLEYIHRLLGRITGFIFIIPFLYFIKKKYFPRRYLYTFLGIFIFGSIQGLIGWLMVKSGLVNHPYVSPFRLGLHLISAFIIFSIILVLLINLYKIRIYRLEETASVYSLLLFATIFLQCFGGALVAGLKAGYIYNNFPFMGENLIADDLFELKPIVLNLFNNPSLVQLFHRLVGLAILAISASYYFYARKKQNRGFLYQAAKFLFIGSILQVALGIITLITQVNIYIAVLHQFVALILFSLSFSNLCIIIRNNLNNKKSHLKQVML